MTLKEEGAPYPGLCCKFIVVVTVVVVAASVVLQAGVRRLVLLVELTVPRSPRGPTLGPVARPAFPVTSSSMGHPESVPTLQWLQSGLPQ